MAMGRRQVKERELQKSVSKEYAATIKSQAEKGKRATMPFIT
jgi:hypothetical protein